MVSRIFSQKCPPNPTVRKTPTGGSRIARIKRARLAVSTP
jgi:hypothetical protein